MHSYPGQSHQTWPEPRKPVASLFESGYFPEGPIQHYKDDNVWRMTSEEMREKERLLAPVYEDVRKASEVHRQVRKYVRSIAKPGIKLYDLAESLEARVRLLVEENGLEAGLAFPTGLSVNNIAAHDSPTGVNDARVLKVTDVMSIDFGVQVNGRIVDDAFTIAFQPQFDPLIQATVDATNAGIRAAGIDVRLCDVSAAIEEVINSFEAEIDGKTRAVKPIRNLCGHSIDPYKIHAGKSVPSVKGGETTRMEEGEFYAIETFASTGNGYVREQGPTTHFMKNYERGHVPLRLPRSKQLLGTINKNFSTLAFCQRYLDRLGEERYTLALRNLCDVGILDPLPPLVDVPGSHTSQLEHTLVLRPTCKEILSEGEVDEYPWNCT